MRAFQPPWRVARPLSHSLAQSLGHLSQVLLGVLLLVLGGALLLTLWLLPVGLPLALLGMALIAAPGNPG